MHLWLPTRYLEREVSGVDKCKYYQMTLLFFNYTTKTKRMSAQIPQTRTTPASVTLLFHEGGR